MKKKGGIWVSAVLYIAMSVVLLTIILAAGLPALQKMKDSYTVRQTKDLMITLDNNIRNVNHEGPSSQRVVNIDIGRGEFVINPDLDNIEWSLESSAILSEIGEVINEGNLQILTQETGVKDKYNVILTLNYVLANIDITYEGPQKLSGDAKLSMLNKGGSPTNIAITQL